MPNTTILLCPYNHSQQLEGRADGTSTYLRDSIQEEENYNKNGVKRDREGGAKNPHHTRGPKKGLLKPSRGSVLSDEPNPSQCNVKNAVTTAIHTLKPRSLAHSLQIHCIEFTGLRSHACWAWHEKRDPTNTELKIQFDGKFCPK